MPNVNVIQLQQLPWVCGTFSGSRHAITLFPTPHLLAHASHLISDETKQICNIKLQLKADLHLIKEFCKPVKLLTENISFFFYFS